MARPKIFSFFSWKKLFFPMGAHTYPHLYILKWKAIEHDIEIWILWIADHIICTNTEHHNFDPVQVWAENSSLKSKMCKIDFAWKIIWFSISKSEYTQESGEIFVFCKPKYVVRFFKPSQFRPIKVWNWSFWAKIATESKVWCSIEVNETKYPNLIPCFNTFLLEILKLMVDLGPNERKKNFYLRWN